MRKPSFQSESGGADMPHLRLTHFLKRRRGDPGSWLWRCEEVSHPDSCPVPRGALSNSHRKRSLELITGSNAVQVCKLVANEIKQNLLKHVFEQKICTLDVRSKQNKRVTLLPHRRPTACVREGDEAVTIVQVAPAATHGTQECQS